jgi:hypothetical protein
MISFIIKTCLVIFELSFIFAEYTFISNFKLIQQIQIQNLGLKVMCGQHVCVCVGVCKECVRITNLKVTINLISFCPDFLTAQEGEKQTIS